MMPYPAPAALLHSLRSTRALVIAHVTPEGCLIDANAGFLHLAQAVHCHGQAVDDLFINPCFKDLTGTRPDDAPLFAGTLTLGIAVSACHSLIGSVTRLRDGTLWLVAEHDIAGWETLSASVLQLNDELTAAQRQLAQRNRELQLQHQKVLDLSRTDPLTGVLNRRHLQDRLLEEIARASRGDSFSVILVDLDHFKRINDEQGHAAGDRALCGSCERFQTLLRPYDLLARWGGEEFLILLPATGHEVADLIANRLCQMLAEAPVGEPPVAVTASFGVATWLPGETSEQLVQRADAALYRAKNAGRNRVVSDIAANQSAPLSPGKARKPRPEGTRKQP